MDLIFIYFFSSFFFIFCFSFILFWFSLLLFFILNLGKEYNVIITQVIKHDGYMTFVTVWSHISQSQVTRSCNIKKNIKGSKINNII